MINRIYTYLAALGGILLAIGAVFLRGKRAGKKEVEAKNNEETLAQIRKTQEAIHKANGKPVSRDDVVRMLQEGEI